MPRGRPKGSPKHGGRQKGTKNKRTLYLESIQADKILSRHGIKPIEEVLKLLPLLEPRDQIKTYMEIQSYLQPKTKPVEPVVENIDENAEQDATTAATAQLLKIVNGGN